MAEIPFESIKISQSTNNFILYQIVIGKLPKATGQF